MDEKESKILEMYFVALRAEVLERLKLVSRIELGKFVIVTTVLGFAIGKAIPEESTIKMATIFGLLPLLAVLFDFYVAYNHAMIHTIGQYIRNNIEKKFTLSGVELWEQYVSKSNQKKWDALGRSVHFFMTFGVMVICFIFFNASLGDKFSICWTLIYIIAYAMLLIVDFKVLRIYKKWKEYYA
jgi:hypothetical protein